MTLLSTIQDVALELGTGVPSAVVTATTDGNAQQLLALTNRAGRELRIFYRWPQLVREYTFTLSSGQASYAIPADFESFAYSTFWDRDNSWEMIGPISASDWQFLKSGVTTAGTRRRWRFTGLTDRQFIIDPTPSASDVGVTLVFEYYSKNWIRPRTWVASTAFAAGSYCFYNGNYYSTTAGGTTGATPPTHTTGSASDGVVTWVYYSGAYEKATADTDVFNINADAIELDVKWRYRQARGLDGWEALRQEAQAMAMIMSGASRGASNINLNASRYLRGYNDPITPDSGFG